MVRQPLWVKLSLNFFVSLVFSIYILNKLYFYKFKALNINRKTYSYPYYLLFLHEISGVIGGILGTIFIKCNIWWCRFRKTSRLGQYPVLEVVMVAFATAIMAYPNEYTRMNTSELIYLLFSQCGVTNQQGICDYKDRNFTNVNHGVSIAEAGSGVNILLVVINTSNFIDKMVHIWTCLLYFVLKIIYWSCKQAPMHVKIFQMQSFLDEKFWIA